MEAPTEDFVARDRAQGLAWRIERILQERRLAWRGDAVGMASLSEDAPVVVAALAGEARDAAEGAAAGRLRDRERPHLVMPFAVAMTTVASHLEAAAALLAAPLPAAGARAARPLVLDALTAAAARIAAFCATYDEKQPLPAPASTDLDRLLNALEARARATDALLTPDREALGPPTEGRLPTLTTSRHGLEDLLLAVRDALPQATGPWRVRPAEGARPLEIARGAPAPEAPHLPAPPAVQRARDVLAFLHPVEVEARGRSTEGPGGDRPVLLTVRLRDPAGASLAPVTTLAAGDEARLTPEAEKAVRALLAASPWASGPAPPPDRLVALLGLLRALDAALSAVLLPRVATPRARAAASDVPRETTRKAPVRRKLLSGLESEFAGFPVHRTGAVLDAVAKGELSGGVAAGDAAIVLALLGRRWNLAGLQGTSSLDLDPLDDAAIEATVRDLVELSPLRQALEGGREIYPEDLTRLERATIAVLGRLGRVEAG